MCQVASSYRSDAPLREGVVPDKAGVRSEHAASRAGKRLKRFIRRQFVLRDPWLVESATSVYAAMAGGRIGYYWRRKQQVRAAGAFPACGAGPGLAGTTASQ
jgi:hypothetical protein